MTFEGLWSSLTHPKDFPSNEWKPQFKDLIGASHSRNYRIWEDEGIASEGLRHIAERDDPKFLESELKDQVSSKSKLQSFTSCVGLIPFIKVFMLRFVLCAECPYSYHYKSQRN